MSKKFFLGLLLVMLLFCGQTSLAQNALTDQALPRLASSLTFRVMVSAFNPAEILTRQVSGRMTIRTEGSIYSQAALDGNGYLEFSIPTASASTWSLEVGSFATRNFSARLVGGFLELTDTETNATIYYWENGDGSYGFEYYKDALYVCNQSCSTAPILGRLSQTSLEPLAAAGWIITTPDSTEDVGYHTSLALDSSARPHISYMDSTYTALKYYNGATATASTLDSAGVTGYYSSIALDSSGRPHISYYDVTNGHLKYYNGATATASTLDSAMAGWHTSLALDSSDKPHISYYDATNGDLKYYNGATSTASTLDSAGNVGEHTSIALDSAGKPHISYYDSTNADLKYYNGATGTISTVDSTGDVGKYTSIALDSAGNPHISYYDSTNADLKYTFYGPAAPASGGIYNRFGGGGRISLPPARAEVSAAFNNAKTSGTGLDFYRALPFSPGAATVPSLQPLLSGAPGLTVQWTGPDGSTTAWAVPCDGSGLLTSAGTFSTATQYNNGVPYIDLAVAFSADFCAGLASGTHTITYWLWDQACNISNSRVEYLAID